MKKKRLVIFSDLDGSLLDRKTYSFEAARPALECLAAAAVPLVFCTSKTRAETEHWRDLLGNGHPFVVENGAAVFAPHGYFTAPPLFDRSEDGYGVLEFGRSYSDVRQALAAIRTSTGLPLRGFGDMTLEEIARVCEFGRDDAARAAARGYDEPFVGADERTFPLVVREAEARGLHVVSGGRFHHLVGDSDKGRAVLALRAIYETSLGPVRTVGIGDSANDIPMLRAVDIPVLVRKPGGGILDAAHLRGLVMAPYSGAQGWNDAVLGLFRRPR